MKSEVQLWEVCLAEAGLLHRVRTNRDLAEARSRVEHEGLSFLTIALPRFEKDLLQAVSIGFVASNHFIGFAKTSGGLPRFLSGFLSQLFDRKGVLRDDASPDVLRSVRQVCLLLSKVEYPVTPQREARAIKAYIATDELLVELNDRLRQKFRSTARALLGEFLQEVESRLYWRDWIPQHSTGALSTRESPNGRWNNVLWTERLQSVLRWEDDLAVNPREVYDLASRVSVLALEDERPAKLVLVPKTMKGPRVIVEEPVYNQYVQQGILRLFEDVLKRPKYRHLADAFSWASQEPNRLLAREGSNHGYYSTIDLSEASDRVSLELMEDLLASVPYLRDAVACSRSLRVEIPHHGEYTLRKFASMGSSLCFPIESMVFFVIISIALAESRAVAPSMLRTSLLGNIRVYGDDIIVPTEDARLTVSMLEAYGLKVNVDKTFTTGLFRESCGSDWFKGRDVSVFKLRTPLPTRARQLESVRSTIRFQQRAFAFGWFAVADWTEALLLRVYGFIPRVPAGSDTDAIWSFEPPTAVRRHRDFHSPEVLTLHFVENKSSDALDGIGALRKSLFKRSEDPYEPDHLQRAGRSQCVGAYIGYTVLS